MKWATMILKTNFCRGYKKDLTNLKNNRIFIHHIIEFINPNKLVMGCPKSLKVKGMFSSKNTN